MYSRTFHKKSLFQRVDELFDGEFESGVGCHDGRGQPLSACYSYRDDSLQFTGARQGGMIRFSNRSLRIGWQMVQVLGRSSCACVGNSIGNTVRRDSRYSDKSVGNLHPSRTSTSVTYCAQRPSAPGSLPITEATPTHLAVGTFPNAPYIYTDAQVQAWKKVHIVHTHQ